MADRSRSLEAVLSASVTGFVSGMGVAKQSALGFARETQTAFERNSRALDTVSNSAFKIGATLTAVAGFAVKSAMDWESAWTGVLKTVEGTPSQLALVEQGLRDLATSMPESHQEIAAVAEAAGQLGVARENIVEFTETMVMLGDTTNLTSEEAATSIAQLINIMGTAPDDVDRLGATLVDLGNKGASTERQIIEMAQRIAGAARVVGLSEANVLALSNAVASTGVEVELGGTAISQVLIKITKDVATNSAALNTWASLAGTSAEEFATAWTSDPAEALVAISVGLNKMGKDGFAVFDQLGLDGQRVQQVLLNLAGANEQLAQSFRNGDVAWRQNIALVAEAEKRYDTADAKARIAWNSIRDAGIGAGQSLLPVVSQLFDAVGDLASIFGALPEGLQGAATGLTGLTGITLLTFAAITKFTAGMAANRLAMIELQATAPLTAAAIGKVGTAAKVALVSLAALYAINKVGNLGEADVAKTSEFTRQLLGVADGSKKAKAELDRLTTFDPSWFNASAVPVSGLKDAFEQADSGLSRILGKFPGFVSASDTASKMIGQIDEALASLVQSGSADKAAQSLEYLQQVTGRSKSELLDQLPLYEEELKKVADESVKTKSAFDDLAGGSTALSIRLAQLASDPEKAAEALAELHQETTEASRSFADFTANLDETGQSFDQWLADLEKAAEAQDRWADNLIKAAVRGVPEGLIRELEEAGPQAATLLDGIANSSEAELARVIDVWTRTGDTAAHVIDNIPPEILTQFNVQGADNAIQVAADVAIKFGVVPKDVETILRAQDWATADIEAVLEIIAEYEKQNPNPKIDADPSGAVKAGNTADTAVNKPRQRNKPAIDADPEPARQGAAEAQSFMDRVKSVTRYINVIKRIFDAEGGAIDFADGGAIQAFGHGGSPRAIGAVRGPGGPKDDLIDARLSNGEHVLTASDVDKLGGQDAVYAMRSQIQAGLFAWDHAYQAAAASFTTRNTGPLEVSPRLQSAASGGSWSGGNQIQIDVTVQAAEGMSTAQVAEQVTEKLMFKLQAAGVSA